MRCILFPCITIILAACAPVVIAPPTHQPSVPSAHSPLSASEAYSAALSELAAMGYTVTRENPRGGVIQAEQERPGSDPNSRNVDILLVTVSEDMDGGSLARCMGRTNKIPWSGHRVVAEPSLTVLGDASRLLATLATVEEVDGR